MIEITDDMCKRAVDAMAGDRFQGFSTPHDSPNGLNRTWGPPHYVRDTSLPGEPVIWKGRSHDKMMERIRIEEMRLALNAALNQ